MSYDRLSELRAHRNNIRRYRRLLETELTELERDFIEKRLAEEHAAFDRLSASTFPMSFQMPSGPTEPAPQGQGVTSA